MSRISEKFKAKFHFGSKNRNTANADDAPPAPASTSSAQHHSHPPSTPLSEKIAGAVEKWSTASATNASPPRIGYLFSAPLVHKAGRMTMI